MIFFLGSHATFLWAEVLCDKTQIINCTDFPVLYMYVPGTTAERKYMPFPCHDEALQRMNKKVAPTELSLLQNKIGN